MFNAALGRISTRTFKDEVLKDQHIDLIADYVKRASEKKGPFDHSVDFVYYLNREKYRAGKKIGTYGLIKNPPVFIGGKTKNYFESIVDYGFLMECLILHLTKEELDTCWLGGTFRRRQFLKDINEDEIVPAITPVGYRAETRSIIDRSMRSSAQSSRRFDMNELFKRYDGSELSFTEDNILLQCLSLVRRAPSASNKQPWRVYIEENKVHFYLKRTPKYPAINLGYDIQALDIGIAICHFVVGLEHHDLEYRYEKVEDPKEFSKEDYVLSIEISK